MQKIIGSIFLLILLIFSANAQNSRKAKTIKPVKPTVNQKDCVPKITSEMVRNFLYGKSIKEIPIAAAPTKSGNWTFQTKELIEIDVIETTFQDNQTIIVARVKTGDAPGLQRNVYDKDNNISAQPAVITLEGRIRLTLENIASQQTLIKLENLTVKYTIIEATIEDIREN